MQVVFWLNKLQAMITWTNDDQVLLRLLAALDHKEASNWKEFYK